MSLFATQRLSFCQVLRRPKTEPQTKGWAAIRRPEGHFCWGVNTHRLWICSLDSWILCCQIHQTSLMGKMMQILSIVRLQYAPGTFTSLHIHPSFRTGLCSCHHAIHIENSRHLKQGPQAAINQGAARSPCWMPDNWSSFICQTRKIQSVSLCLRAQSEHLPTGSQAQFTFSVEQSSCLQRTE